MDEITIHKTIKEKADEIVNCGERNLPIHPYVCDIIHAIEYPQYYILYHAENKSHNVVGYLMCQTLNGKNKMYISSLCVDSEYRRKGIGRKLIEECKDECKERRTKNVRLHVHKQNEGAIKLYNECGFIIEDTIPDYYGGIYKGASTQDAYVMKCRIQQEATSCFWWKSNWKSLSRKKWPLNLSILTPILGRT